MALELKTDTYTTATGAAWTPYGVFSVGDNFTVTGSQIDFEAYKAQFQQAIMSYANRLGGFELDLNLTDNNGLATVRAVLTFQSMIDACYFAQMWPDGDVPAVCAIFQPM